jgi:hypothetical protein
MAGTLHFHFRDQWRELKRSRPGHRFRDRYARAREEAHECGAGQRILTWVIGIVALAIAAFLSVFPGPAIPFFVVAGGLFATESRTIARFMDWAEVRGRRVAAWGKKRWRKLPTVARVALLIAGGCASAGMAFLTYRFMTG